MRKRWWLILVMTTLGVDACDNSTSGSDGPSAGVGPSSVLAVQPSNNGGSAATGGSGQAGASGSSGAMLVPAAAGSSARVSVLGGASGSGTAGASAGAAAVGGASGSASGASGGASGAAGSAGGAGISAPSTGSLPPVSDLESIGPFTSSIQNGTGPDSNYRLDYPKELGDAGIKHPLVVFAAGGGFPENYDTLLRYLASQGFVVLTYAATSEDGQGLLDGLDWLIAQHAAASGMLSGMLDTAHVAASGHSFGSLAAFNAAPDARLTTTLHLQGGSLDPHDVVKKLRAPALFICGETPTGDQDGTFTGDMANPNCAIDFAMAETPVFYGSLSGAAHIQLTESVDDPKDSLRMRMLGAIGGWLRWRLAGDESQRSRYVGSDCELCKPDTGWTVMQKGLD